MPVEFREESGGRVIGLRASGRVTRRDYQRYAPEIDRLVRTHGAVSIRLELTPAFEGWGRGTVWESARLGLKHFTHVERLALVGEPHRTRRLRRLCRLFTTGQIRCFEPGQSADAAAWLRTGSDEGAAAAT